MSDTGPRGADKLNILGIVTVGICGAVLTYVSIVLLEAFYMTDTAEIERQNAFENPASLRNTVKAAHLTNLHGDKEGTIAIDRAIELIVAEAQNDPSNLVPAVGPSRTPTVLPEYGRPLPVPPPAAVPAPTEPAPAEPDPDADARTVEVATKLGERLIAEEKYWDAIQMLEGALPKAKGKSAGRVRYLLSKAFIKNPHWVRRAEELLLLIVKDEPQHIGAHVMLGQIYKQGGLKARAASMYRRVLELNADHEEAAHALHDLGSAAESEGQPEPEPPQGGGLLKRLFGKG